MPWVHEWSGERYLSVARQAAIANSRFAANRKMITQNRMHKISPPAGRFLFTTATAAVHWRLLSYTKNLNGCWTSPFSMRLLLCMSFFIFYFVSLTLQLHDICVWTLHFYVYVDSVCLAHSWLFFELLFACALEINAINLSIHTHFYQFTSNCI